MKSHIIPLFGDNSCVYFEVYFSDLFSFSFSKNLGENMACPLFTMLLFNITLNSLFSDYQQREWNSACCFSFI